MRTQLADPLPRTGSRIVLRRLQASDLTAFQAYRSDPEVGRFQGWSPMPVPAAVAFLTGMNAAPFGVAGEWFQLGIAERTTDRLIGDIGFCICGPENQHAELGFSLSREFQGQGLATEAIEEFIQLIFERTAVTCMVVMTDERNQPCIRLLERLGGKRVSQVNSVLRGERFTGWIYIRQRGG